MDIENAGAGAGVGGLMGMILTLLGIKSKFNDMDKKIDKIEEKAVWRDTCVATHKSVDEGIKRIETKLDNLILRFSKKESE